MEALIQQEYDALPPAVQELVNQLILTLRRPVAAVAVTDHWPQSAGSTTAAEEKPFTGLKGYGSMPGIWMSEDFDEPLEDFKDYM